MENCDETHTSIADEFEEKAQNIDISTNHPHSSCYEGLMEQTELLRRARKHQEEQEKYEKSSSTLIKKENQYPQTVRC